MTTLKNASFANPKKTFEDLDDSALILGDQDETLNGGEGNILSLENEPMDFIRGEVDVKAQIDRANARAGYIGAFADTREARDEDFGKMGEGTAHTPSEDDADHEAGAFPLSVDEASLQGETLREKTLNQMNADQKNDVRPYDQKKSNDSVNGANPRAPSNQHGHLTGALTDIGAGRSGVTRSH